ncbi:FCD domain-containing protein [Galbitalea sp. SE-J8]|uniref:FadR/GntR family transcriptional regulator n=1 Tax=Galbitalea sp. SE-J8 TaxID=3054952 RepID=UPI00259C8CAD|nr:FCD domain-containing protein [Galbitalea sp. SE-J8]MDM4762790.1 FCD domain-containing protein [Galbitalea sp. SE-J8]
MPGILHDRVLDDLGSRIVLGLLPAGSVVVAESLAGQYGVSMSVVRGALGVLQSLGLVTATRRVGIRVQASARWAVLDRRVIGWRLAAASTRGAQFRSLTELRSAIEPAAAELAARFATPETGRRLHELSIELEREGREGDLHAFMALDIRFHALVLEASGNELFAALADDVAEVLRERTLQGLMPRRPHEEALRLHRETADAIERRDPDAARAAMDRIMRRTAAEVEQVWREAPRAGS